jgi:alpha-galactosidase
VCFAISKIVVHLPNPGRTFSAVVGVDANIESETKGSVVFSVIVGSKVVLQSEVLKSNMEGVPIEANLDGATELMLEVGDAGDGVGGDQADWADALVTLTNGKSLWLGDMPLRDKRSAVAMKLPRTSELPFAFLYDGRSSDDLLWTWQKKSVKEELDRNRTQYALIWTDLKTGLEIRCVAVEYADFPVIEWTVYFKNTGRENTPILENIQALNVNLERGRQGEFILHHWKGDCEYWHKRGPDLYEPLYQTLLPSADLYFATPDG